MNVLLVNDDGIDSAGIASLRSAIEDICEVFVVAPESERSACSHSITLRSPVSAIRLSEREYAVDGTPADCVDLAVLKLFADVRFDLFLSGINYGHNVGEDVSYSGTVGAAIEATMLGLRSIALSVPRTDPANFDAASKLAREILLRFPVPKVPQRTFLNINLPPGDGPFPIMVTRQGRLHFLNTISEQTDCDAQLDSACNEQRFKIGRTTKPDLAEEGTDVYAVNHGFISVTPMRIDLTDRGAFILTEALLAEAFGQEAKLAGPGGDSSAPHRRL